MRRYLVIPLVVLLLAAACSAGSPAGPPSSTPSEASPTPSSGASTPPAQQGITKVLTIVEENEGSASAKQGMPYLASLGRTYAVATAYHSLAHPSLPNYLAMTAGSTLGVTDDDGPSAHPIDGPSVFDLALAKGHTAKVYAESMPSNCARQNSGRYAARHNTWTYFTSSTQCQTLDVPADQIDADVAAGTLPDVGLLIPDLCHDAHDCALGEADAYLHDVMTTVLSGPDWKAGRLVVVVTFDEVDGDGGGTLLTTVVAPTLHHVRVATPLSHYSWCRWMTDLVGAAPLRKAATATSMGKAFHL